MVTILLEKIIALLTGFFGDFIEWANTVGDKIASIKDNTDSLPDIKDNTDSIAADTPYIKSAVQNLNTWASNIYNRVNGIEQKTDIIKNNSGSIATSSGTAAAFAEDIANNTLDMDSRLVTIGSDTTQIRADSGNLAADVAEIKDTLGLYLYNTIVTEDAEGNIASCDTDLKDYLTEAKVIIPADAGGITGINLTQVGTNIWSGVYEEGAYDTNTGQKTPNANMYRSINSIPVIPNTTYRRRIDTSYGFRILYYDINEAFISSDVDSATSVTFTTPNNCYFINIYYQKAISQVSINYPSDISGFIPYVGMNKYPITFTSITDGAEIDLLTGIIKINTSPVTYDSITPIAIRTYKGVNNIYSDIGTTSVTYRETLKHYLKKQEA